MRYATSLAIRTDWRHIAAWRETALGTIQKVLRDPLTMHVVNVVGGGDQDWALVELEANGVCKNGGSHGADSCHRCMFKAPLTLC